MPLAFNIMDNCKEVQTRLTQIADRLADLRPVFQDFEGRMQRSISLNFQRGGRPDPWVPSKRALNKGRGKDKIGQTLLKTKVLRDSLTIPGAYPGAYTSGPDFMEIATNVPYAKTHQYGAKKGSFGTASATIKEHDIKGFARRGGEVKAHVVKAHVRKGKPVREHTINTFLRKEAQVSGHKIKSHTRKILLPWGDIPQRRFLLVQKSDVSYLKQSITRYVLQGNDVSQALGGELA